MALKAILKTLDGLSEEVAGLYVKKDDAFILDLDGVDDLPAVAGLRNTARTEREERKKFEKQFKSLESQISGLDLEKLKDIDPDDYAGKLELLEKYEKNEKKRKTQKLKDEKNWEKLESQLREQHQREIETLQSKFGSEKQSLLDQIADVTKTNEATVGKMEASLITHLRDKKLIKEVTDAKGNVTLLSPHITPFIKVAADDAGNYDSTVIDADGNQRFNNLGKPMTIKELVSEFGENPDFSGAFEKEKKPGGAGSQGGRGDDFTQENPFKEGEHHNLTKQAQILTKDPQLAKKLQAQATAGKE